MEIIHPASYDYHRNVILCKIYCSQSCTKLCFSGFLVTKLQCKSCDLRGKGCVNSSSQSEAARTREHATLPHPQYGMELTVRIMVWYELCKRYKGYQSVRFLKYLVRVSDASMRCSALPHICRLFPLSSILPPPNQFPCLRQSLQLVFRRISPASHVHNVPYDRDRN